MTVGQLQMRQTLGQIGIQTKNGQFNIEQNPAQLTINTVNTKLDIHSEQPAVLIDQSRTWDALNGGKPMAFWNRVYNQSGQYVERAISRINEKYDRLGDIHLGGNPIAEVARQSTTIESPFQVFGPAYADNIDFEAIIQKPEINVEPGYVDIRSEISKPNIEYLRGDVKVYMRQNPSLEIIPPQIDVIA